jgi:hypothetical protein
MNRILQVSSFIAIFLSLATMTAAHAAWKSYPINEGGFSVAMPSAPKSRLIQTGSKDGVLHVYEAVEASDLPSKYSVFVSQPETQGIFEHDSIDAFLKAHISSMVAAAESGKLISSSRTTFRGHPALEYKFSHSIDGVPYIARGVTLMIDGGHIRVSMWHPSEQTKSEGRFNEFLSSFKLIPIAYSPSGSQFSDPRGISFTPGCEIQQSNSLHAVVSSRHFAIHLRKFPR